MSKAGIEGKVNHMSLHGFSESTVHIHVNPNAENSPENLYITQKVNTFVSAQPSKTSR